MFVASLCISIVLNWHVIANSSMSWIHNDCFLKMLVKSFRFYMYFATLNKNSSHWFPNVWTSESMTRRYLAFIDIEILGLQLSCFGLIFANQPNLCYMNSWRAGIRNCLPISRWWRYILKQQATSKKISAMFTQVEPKNWKPWNVSIHLKLKIVCLCLLKGKV